MEQQDGCLRDYLQICPGVIAEDVSVGRMPTLQKSCTFNLQVASFRLSNICCSHRCACINCFDMHIFDLLCCEHTYDSITFFSGNCSAQFHISWISGDTSMALVWRLWQMLSLSGEAQLAIDTTLVFALRRDGTLNSLVKGRSCSAGHPRWGGSRTVSA